MDCSPPDHIALTVISCVSPSRSPVIIARSSRAALWRSAARSAACTVSFFVAVPSSLAAFATNSSSRSIIVRVIPLAYLTYTYWGHTLIVYLLIKRSRLGTP